MRSNRNEQRLNRWKERQIAEGYDVSEVKTLAEAERFVEEVIHAKAKVKTSNNNAKAKDKVVESKEESNKLKESEKEGE